MQPALQTQPAVNSSVNYGGEHDGIARAISRFHT